VRLLWPSRMSCGETRWGICSRQHLPHGLRRQCNPSTGGHYSPTHVHPGLRSSGGYRLRPRHAAVAGVPEARGPRGLTSRMDLLAHDIAEGPLCLVGPPRTHCAPPGGLLKHSSAAKATKQLPHSSYTCLAASSSEMRKLPYCSEPQATSSTPSTGDKGGWCGAGLPFRVNPKPPLLPTQGSRGRHLCRVLAISR
jgi:hypothetical protein